MAIIASRRSATRFPNCFIPSPAREWSREISNVHYPIALKARIKIADAIADGRRPVGMSGDEEIVYDFPSTTRTSGVSDATFARASSSAEGRRRPDRINAYYTLLAMQMNVARYKVPAGGLAFAALPD